MPPAAPPVLRPNDEPTVGVARPAEPQAQPAPATAEQAARSTAALVADVSTPPDESPPDETPGGVSAPIRAGIAIVGVLVVCGSLGISARISGPTTTPHPPAVATFHAGDPNVQNFWQVATGG
jgi:hypothetical protein